MTSPALRRHLAPAILAVLCGLLLAAPAANATIFNTWIGLNGLQAPTPSWVRAFSTGTPPTTVYAATQGDGVYISNASGLPNTWSKMGTLPPNAQEVYQVYTGNGKVYAVTGGGLYSTPSGSTSWTPDGVGPESDGQHPTKLDAVPQAVISLTGGTLLAGTVSQGVWRSGDGGSTWSAPKDDNGMPQDDTVWGMSDFLNFVWAATSDGIYRSSDQGATWTLANDGIPFGAVTLNIFQDGKVPSVFYAATGSAGVYRTLDGGVTWQPLDYADFGGGQVHDMKEFSGDKETRLYVATSNGVWIATMPNLPAPGPAGGLQDPLSVTWRHMTEDGLATPGFSNDIFWALDNFISTPGTFLGGTQSNGGYMLIMQPPANNGQSANLPGWIGQSLNVQFHVGDAVVGTDGNWTGTPDIDYAFQWQRCTSSTPGSCSDIDGADSQLYTFAAADESDRFRVCVTATNDFPEPVKALHTACSALAGLAIAHQPGPLPGDVQMHSGTIAVTPASDQNSPTEGDTLSAPAAASAADQGYWFNPGASNVGYQWDRCDVDGNNCDPIPGAKSSTYLVTAADNGIEIRVDVKGTNVNGTTQLPISGATLPIIPLPAAMISAPTLLGTQTVGSALTGTVGTWKSPATYWARQWERCEADGSDCEPISGATGPEYTLVAADNGMKVRLHVSADVNPAIQLPLAVDAYSALSAVITYPPGVTPPVVLPAPLPIPPPTPAPGPAPGPAPKPAPKPAGPKVSAFKLVQAKKGSELSFKLSATASIVVKLQLRSTGHLARKHCVAGKGHHAKACTLYTTVETISRRKLKAGTHAVLLVIKVHGKMLKRGTYRAVITPRGTSGTAGKAQSLKLVLR